MKMEYPSINENLYSYDWKNHRLCIIEDIAHFFNIPIYRVYDVFGDNKVHKRIHDIMDPLYMVNMHHGCSGGHLLKEYGTDFIPIFGGQIYASVPEMTHIVIPHIVIFDNVYNYERWIYGAMLSLISNSIIVAPLYDMPITRDMFNVIIDAMINSEIDRCQYNGLMEVWNEKHPEWKVEGNSMPDYDYDTLDIIVRYGSAI